MDKSIFFKEADDSDYSKQSGGGLEIDIRLNNTIFYIYLIIIFIFALGQYIYNDKSAEIIKITENKSKVVLVIHLILTLFNLSGIIFLTYHIYKQIENLSDKCPYPNETLCHLSVDQCPLMKQGCSPDNASGIKLNNCNMISDSPSFWDTDINMSASMIDNGKYTLNLASNAMGRCPNDILDFINDNFIITDGSTPGRVAVPAPAPAPAPTGPAPAPAPAPSAPVPAPFAPVLEPSASLAPAQDLSWVAKESELEKVEQEVEEILDRLNAGISGNSIAGPPGPPGPPGNDGVSTMSQQSNWTCDEGACPPGYTTCNDKGECEPFALISLEEKINLKNKYKDAGHNSYEAAKLMDNLEEYLLKIFK